MSSPPHIALPTSDAPNVPDWADLGRSVVTSEADMDAMALRLSQRLQAGDTLLLSGAVGAGKTHLARALIRTWLNAPDEPVPSPTFTLVQTYGPPDREIWHADLYRLGDPDEIAELGLEEAFGHALCLIEWPDRLAPDWPGAAVLLHLERREDESRLVRLLAPTTSALGDRLAQALQP